MLIKINDALLFGNEAAEDEIEEIFAAYAIDRPEVTNFLDTRNPIAIARAYKGEGKSALLRLVGIKLAETSHPPNFVISIPSSTISPDLDIGDSDKWVRKWKINILKIAIKEIERRVGFICPDTPDEILEEAETNNLHPTFVAAVTERSISHNRPIKRSAGIISVETIETWKSKGCLVWFIIDDLDQNFENTTNQKTKIAAFFTAIRQLAKTIPEFRFRTSVRPNVWATIKREYEALSHIEQYIHDLKWSLADFEQLIAKRITGYLEYKNMYKDVAATLPSDKNSRDIKLISMVFNDPMPWGKDTTRKPSTILYTLARQRPRWLIELWRVSANSAAGFHRTKVSFEDINKELASFGQRRIDDTIAEFRSQCPQIEDLLVAFVGQSERFTTDELMKTLNNRILQATHPIIVGIVGKPTAREVAHFLFQIGFLTARKDHATGYEHVAYAENPSLLESKVNIDQGYSWEIHPVFRQALKLKNY